MKDFDNMAGKRRFGAGVAAVGTRDARVAQKAGMPDASCAASMTRRDFVGASVGALALAGCATLLPGCSGMLEARDMRKAVDMGAREVFIPSRITKVFCTNPIGTVDLYGLAPDMIAGWNFLPAGDARKYIADEYLELPSLGVWMGAGSVPNAEEVAAQNPDVLLCYWTVDDVGRDMADEIAEQTGLPVMLVDYDLRSAPEMFRFAGELLGRAERGEELAALCERMIEQARSIAQSIPENERKRVFLAQGADGLTTDPVGSMHVTDALELINTENVADMPGTKGQGMGMPSVNLEQLISWNPDAVLVAEFSMSDAESSDIYGGIKADAHWNNVPCVAAGEIYRIPQAPFSWFGRPPSAVRALGCLWLLKVLYPDYADEIDMREETLEFYRVFYGYDGFDEESLGRLLESAGIDAETGKALEG